MTQGRSKARLATAIAPVATLIALWAILGTPGGASGSGQAVGDGTGAVELVEVGPGFSSPLNTAFAPGEASNLYVVQQGGEVAVLVDGVEQPDPFLDLSDKTNGSGEQGLLSIAFHPKYPAKPFVYAYYTRAKNGDIVVAEFDASDPLEADESTRRKVIRIKHRSASNHNGGQIAFGPDGKLYLATGDGGGGGDPQENAQDRKSLLGKLLRINPKASARRGYRVPRSNPFVGKNGRGAIYALGLRNPFRFNFDPETGWMMIGDVGQGAFEEIDIESEETLRKANFGWDRWEGFKRHRSFGDNSARRPKRKRHTKPSHAYGRDLGQSVIGGLVVRDESLTNLYGRYVFADFFTDRLRSFVPTLGRVNQATVLEGTPVSLISSFAQDPATSEVYLTSLGGEVFRLEPDPSP